MDLNGMGLLGAIIVGGIAGWLAEQFMKSNMGFFMNIMLGIVGAAFLNFLLSVLGIYTGTRRPGLPDRRLHRRLPAHCSRSRIADKRPPASML